MDLARGKRKVPSRSLLYRTTCGHSAWLQSMATGGKHVTGAVPGMTREEAFDAVAAAGGSPQKAVSGKTHVLVVGEGAGRRKAEAAEARGVAVIDAEAFLRVLAGEEPPPPR